MCDQMLCLNFPSLEFNATDCSDSFYWERMVLHQGFNCQAPLSSSISFTFHLRVISAPSVMFISSAIRSTMLLLTAQKASALRGVGCHPPLSILHHEATGRKNRRPTLDAVELMSEVQVDPNQSLAHPVLGLTYPPLQDCLLKKRKDLCTITLRH
ncbi:hypothetical protein CEXT_179151 [Caerostris extrusa]|uniref:Uncharacterized protein n=1 Tax=Caerostris extrusa TaxID=172846 RepID=A0AAV4QXK9_CAEEX|nr:hypothetical protein CEXT_179151 [Caerostris extrusa]